MVAIIPLNSGFVNNSFSSVYSICVLRIVANEIYPLLYIEGTLIIFLSFSNNPCVLLESGLHYC